MNAEGALATFHSATQTWFAENFEAPSEAQAQSWPAIGRGEHTLLAAPTGSGKTLAAFLCAIDGLVRQAAAGTLEPQTNVVYISPLKALGNDVEKNLQAPLQGILAHAGLPQDAIRTAVRSGDTTAYERRKQLRTPAHVFVTTPESLYILLTSKHGRAMLRTARTVIVDEIHAMVGDKRGVHLALSLERLRALCDAPLQRIGLSATQRPIETVGRFLVGEEPSGCTIVDTGHRRAMDVQVEVPQSPLSAVMSAEVWTEVHRRLADLIDTHATTLIFVNTRRIAERLTAALEELVGVDAVMTHHGSLSRKHRLVAEQRLKNGELKALVATASLELGIDIGDVDLVCQIGATRSIASLLQRVGRSGHALGLIPKGRVFPLTRDELVTCAALFYAVQNDTLDTTQVVEAPLDILAQQIVAAVASRDWDEEALFSTFIRSYPYRNLSRERFDDVVHMLAEGFTTRRGRRGAYLHHDAVNKKLKARRGAGITAMTCGGAIPDIANYDVVLQSSNTRIGSLDEDFAIETMVGDVFRLGDNAWQVLKVETGRVYVRNAAGMPPSIPFWFGEAPARTAELSEAVSDVRQKVAAYPDSETATQWLVDACALSAPAARQAAEYLIASRAALGKMPTHEQVVIERFFDESGGMQLVVHSPFGARLNRAWGLALRKRFCRRFNFELQAAATEDAIVLSLGVTHSFALDEVFDYLSETSVRHVLIQALLDAPVFETRWRWNANRSLAIPRFRNGKRVPAALQRMNAEDLISVVFPDQIACLENIPGEREIPDHPLVDQTIEDCLIEAMDIHGLERVLRGLANGDIARHAVDLTEPSPLAAEILNAAPYAFLDDAPLEERRTNAVRSRRFVSAEDAAALGTLDDDAVSHVREVAWPLVRDADELHDALVVSGCLAPTLDGLDAWTPWFEQLAATGRAVAWTTTDGTLLWWATERVPEGRAAHDAPGLGTDLAIPPRYDREVEFGPAMLELVRGRLEISGPIAARDVAIKLGLPRSAVDDALRALQGEGFAMCGQYTGGERLWCERRLLARIHRLTLDRLRARVQPVSPTAYVRYLTRLQRVAPDDRAEGVEGLFGVIEQLQGVSAPAGAWESQILPARVRDYSPFMLDQLCLQGRVTWGRSGKLSGGHGPIRTTHVHLAPRSHAELWASRPLPIEEVGRDGRRVHAVLTTHGALFFDDIRKQGGGLAAQVMSGLAELVSAGWAVSDSFAGLRALLEPAEKRGRRGRWAPLSVAGRWSLVSVPEEAPTDTLFGVTDAVVAQTEALLSRHGVLFRAVLERETAAPPWRDVLRVLRRLEARGELRGGRFVSTFAGEQYARAEVVTALRGYRELDPERAVSLALSAVDPAAVVGHVLRDTKVAALQGNRVFLRGGEVVAVRESGETRFVCEDVALGDRRAIERQLLRSA